MGAIIAPPAPAFYAGPQTLDDMVDFTVGRVLDLFAIDGPPLRRWDEDPDLQGRPSPDGPT
jgi:flavin prenyltransferase